MSAAGGTKAVLPWDDPVLRVTSDPPRRAQYRALQSWYRETVLKVPPGLQASGQPLGSLLPAEREREGRNFLDEKITDYAERRAIEVLGRVERWGWAGCDATCCRVCRCASTCLGISE